MLISGESKNNTTTAHIVLGYSFAADVMSKENVEVNASKLIIFKANHRVHETNPTLKLLLTSGGENDRVSIVQHYKQMVNPLNLTLSPIFPLTNIKFGKILFELNGVRTELNKNITSKENGNIT